LIAARVKMAGGAIGSAFAPAKIIVAGIALATGVVIRLRAWLCRHSATSSEVILEEVAVFVTDELSPWP
jgi:hypothetical protein